ncbi:hypothetical protein [Timonella sp. A28]|uniref:hypothetical protein n=1 Tax=Timonella sp. A28 TaxID=3442640 RepID=UPI003EC05602
MSVLVCPESARFYPAPEEQWWADLGLNVGVSPNVYDCSQIDAEKVAARVLSEYRPTGFVRVYDIDPRPIDFSDLVAEVKRALEDERRNVVAHAEIAQAQHRAAGWNAIHTRWMYDDAHTLVETGEWAGFTHGEAYSWCVTLYQYEARGVIQPGAQLRYNNVKILNSGGIPAGFKYAERARALTGEGFSAEEYRLVCEQREMAIFTDGLPIIFGA